MDLLQAVLKHSITVHVFPAASFACKAATLCLPAQISPPPFPLMLRGTDKELCSRKRKVAEGLELLKSEIS